LWQLADSYNRMGDRFEDRAAAAYTRIVKDYPLSDRAEEAAAKLKEMNRPVPEADPVAYARMKYEMENRQKIGVMSHMLGMFKHSPETRTAAKSGTPAMAAMRPAVPLSVPAALNGSAAGGTSDVTVQNVTDSTALDTKPDARMNPPAAAGSSPSATAAPENGSAERAADSTAKGQLPPPTNHTPPKKKKNKKKNDAPQTTTQQTNPPPADSQAASKPQQ
jgi:outer membrane protein assembly factor BamD